MNLRLLWGLLRTKKLYARWSILFTFGGVRPRKYLAFLLPSWHMMHLLHHTAMPLYKLAIIWLHFLSESSYRIEDPSLSPMKYGPFSLYPSLLLHGWKAWLSKQACSDSRILSPDSLLFHTHSSLGSDLLFWGWISAASL